MAINFITGETYTLPSKGLVYDKEINPVVTLRSMTTEEEMRRLNLSDRPYKIMAGIIDDCLVDKLGISAYDLCVGDYQFLLHKLRVATYGPEYSLSVKCPYCGTVSEETINLDDFPVKEYSEDIHKYMEFDLPMTKQHISLRMQTPRLLDDVSAMSKDFKKKASSFKGEPAFLFTLKSLIKSVDGGKPDPITFEEDLRKLPMRDASYIIQMGEKMNDCIGLNTDMLVECPYCGMESTAPFRITKEFFGPTIQF